MSILQEHVEDVVATKALQSMKRVEKSDIFRGAAVTPISAPMQSPTNMLIPRDIALAYNTYLTEHREEVAGTSWQRFINASPKFKAVMGSKALKELVASHSDLLRMEKRGKDEYVRPVVQQLQQPKILIAASSAVPVAPDGSKALKSTRLLISPPTIAAAYRAYLIGHPDEVVGSSWDRFLKANPGFKAALGSMKPKALVAAYPDLLRMEKRGKDEYVRPAMAMQQSGAWESIAKEKWVECVMKYIVQNGEYHCSELAPRISYEAKTAKNAVIGLTANKYTKTVLKLLREDSRLVYDNVTHAFSLPPTRHQDAAITKSLQSPQKIDKFGVLSFAAVVTAATHSAANSASLQDPTSPLTLRDVALAYSSYLNEQHSGVSGTSWQSFMKANPKFKAVMGTKALKELVATHSDLLRMEKRGKDEYVRPVIRGLELRMPSGGNEGINAGVHMVGDSIGTCRRDVAELLSTSHVFEAFTTVAPKAGVAHMRVSGYENESTSLGQLCIAAQEAEDQDCERVVYPCGLCHKKFSAPEYVNQHSLRVHLQPWPRLSEFPTHDKGMT